METTKEQAPFEKSYNQKLMDFFDKTELALLYITLMGSANLMGQHIIDKNPNLLFMDSSTRYAILQFSQMYLITAGVVRGELEKGEGIGYRHMPTGGDSWQTNNDFELRIALLVKHLYNVLLKEGKIPMDSVVSHSEQAEPDQLDKES